MPFPAAGNFVITDDLGLGQGGTVQKYNDNVAAIRLLKAIEAGNRQATDAEQRILARYVGWGGIKQAFPNPNNPPAKGWEKRVTEIRELLTPEEHEAAARSIQDAHYTSKAVVEGMWKIARRLGFDGGKVLEDSMGVGNFFGLMPADLRATSSLTGIELDSITARIAKQLYPKANVMGPVGFHEVNLANNTFNLNIGNPPFGNQPLYDPNAKHLKGFSIHNFFFAKAIDKLAPGGLHIQVVSRYFMDAETSPAREYIAHRTQLVGAIRLPWTAFYGNAGTEVVTDIVILKKLPEDRWGASDQSWVGTTTIPDPLGGEPMRVNAYYAAHPNMILGQMDRSGEMQHENDITVQPRDGQSIEEGLEDVMGNLPENIYERGKTAEQVNAEQVAAVAPEDVIENYSIGQYFQDDGKLLQRVMTDDGSMKAVEITAETQWSEKQTWGDRSRIERLRGMIGIRQTTRDLLKAEATDEPDAKIKKLRSVLNKRYDAFTAKHGYLNETANEQVFAADPDAPLLLALEDEFDGGISKNRAKTLGIKPRKAVAKKMPIFTRRVVRPHVLVTSADSPEDGLALSISEKGMVSVPYIAGLTRQSEQDVIDALTKGATPQIYFDPAKKGYELAADYMAGNVKRKYREALNAGLHAQAEALKKVFPEDVKAGDLRARLGAPWIDSDAYEGFVRHLLGEDAEATIRYVQATGGFAVNTRGGDPAMVRTRWGAIYTTEGGVTREARNAHDLINRILNSRDMTILNPEDKEGKRTVNVEATQASIDKADEIRQEFEDWIFKDPDQRERLVQFYNDHFNTNINSVIDGTYLKLPGKVPDAVIKLRRHQLNAVARLIRRGKALLDHVVGAGKTFTIIAGVMEKRRLGLAKKPMIVVPNHLVEQWATDFYRLYPGAKVLAMRKKDFEKSNRQRMLARVATGDWDAVIFSHSSFGFIENDREVLLAALRKQVFEIQQAIDMARDTEGKKSRTASQYQKTKEKLEQRLKALIDKPRDKLLTFQEIGIDDLTVDESQEFKNLFFTTQKQNVGGFGNPTGSKKAFDMFIKTQWLQKTNGGRGVTFATGTPVSNSLTELFTLQRYLGMEELEARGITSLDAWLAAFGVVQSEYESNVTGTKYKRKERLRRLTNVPEVMQLYKEFADSITNDQIKQNYREDNNGEEFPIPGVKSHPKARNNIVVPRTALQEEFSAGLQLRMEQLKRGGTDNALAILGDGRKAALDMRLVDPSAPDHKGSKTHEAADQIHRIYKESDKKSGTQLVFLDISTPLKHGLSQAKKYLKEARDLLDDATAANYGSYGEQWSRLQGMLQERMESMEDHDDSKGVDAIERFLAQSVDIDAAVTTVDKRFSVYDDMRSKLIERGIPNNEIAFIHDFNGDAKKQELFDMVNAGRVRVLLGSTAKMGAGTNVQRKLVAIHHLDAPWRPSDIEQREGRGIRQGNEFRQKRENGAIVYDDPNFAIEILAYATEGTSDVFFWQTQEQKLIAINSLRNYKGEREIEDVSMDSMSAAEMKALSSGNPLILEDVQLTESIRKLEGQRRRHISGQQDMESEVRKYDKAINGLPAVIERQEGEVAKILAYQKDPFEGARPTADMDGKKMNAQEADQYVHEVIAEAKDDHKKANAAVFAQIDALKNQIVGERGSARKKTLDEIEALETELPPVEWSVTFAGKEYHNRDTAHRAIVKALGDVEAIRMVVDGESLIRRSEIEAKIEPVVQGFADANKGEHTLGTIAGLPVKLSWLQSRGSRIPAAVKIELGGETEYVHGPTDEDIGAGQSAEIPARSVRSKVEFLLDNAAYSLKQNKSYLDRAMKGVEPLRANLGKEWGRDEELNQKRARLTFVRNELSGKNAEDKAKAEREAAKADDTPAQLSRSPRRRTQSISLDDAKAHWDNLTAGFKNLPRVNFLNGVRQAPDNLLKQIRAAKAENTVLGAYHQGEVFIFSDNIPDLETMERFVAQHELRHYGMEGKYGNQLRAALLNLRDLNPKLRAEADALKAKYKDLDDSAAVNEALADKPLDYAKKLSGWKRFKANLRAWLVAHGYKRLARLFSNDITADEITRDFLYQAEAFYKGKAKSETTHLYETNFGRGDAPPASSRELGSQTPRSGMQERPTVRADETGSSEEPAQSRTEGVAGRREGNLTSLEDALQAFRESQPIDRYEYDRKFKDIKEEVERDWANGNSDEYSRTYGPDEIHADLKNENAAEYYDDDGYLTGPGNDRYNELTDELSSKIAKDELGEPERRQIDITDPSDMADFLHNYLERQGFEPHAISGSGKSRSKYFDVVANGERKTLRIADHKLPSEYGDSDLELALYDVAPDDVRADGREMSVGIDEEVALRRAADVVAQISPENPDIRFSRPDLNALAAGARERVGDLLTSQRTFNRWWHTTIGTQFHKAQQDRDFKKVFDLGQEYLTDTTRYAMIPEMEAPDLLLRLERVKDALPAFLGGRKVLSKADSEAIAAPIFRGTLEDEKVYSDEELKDDFGLTDKQIGYYRQFRAAVDRSLDEMTKSVLAKMARAVGVGEDLVRRLRVSDIGLDAFYKPLVREMRARVKELQERADETTGPDKSLRLNEAAVARKQVRAVVTAYNRVRRLKADGYAPLMRFGKNTVHVQGDDGETVYFGLYESQREANAAARALEQEYPDAAVSKGILSDESYKLFNGLSPETVELFADIAGMDKAPAFQEYLRLAVNNRSALKRLMKREGTPGFSQDVSRVLAQFIVSNARTAAGNYHLGDLQKAVEDVPRRKGDVKDEAFRLFKYLTDPQEEVAWLRGYLFFNFLGGSIASALVNATQPVMMTAPYLSQFVDAGKLGKIMARASMEAAKDAPGADVRQAYDRAMKEGVVAPHEIYQLMAQAQDQIGSGHLHRLMKGWGSFFSLAEAFNRRISFIAAYRVAVEADMANPYQFAKNAVAETQGLYNKGNRPNWARGAVGATIFTFKQFSISYMEFIKRLPNKQRAIALALLFLAAGAEGEPFAEDIMDVIDTIGQWMGHATNSKRWLRRKAAETLGEGAGQFVLHGVSAFLPLDISARMGLGNLIPGTGVLKTSQIEKSRDATEFLGPIGGVARSIGSAATHAGTGEYGAAVKDMMPVAVQNALKGMDMWQKGEYRDARGRKVIETTPGEAAVKAIGFQPASVARQQDKVGDNLQDVNLVRATESGIADKWAHGLADQDSDKIAEARRELIRWNANNPELRIVITSQQLKSRVQAIKSTRADRTLKTTPKELRGRVAEDLR